MAGKLRDTLSELATDVKSLNIDDRISFRYLWSKFSSKLAYFLRIEARSRELMDNSAFWLQINCMELIDSPVTACGFIDGCNTLKRTKNKLPKAFDTNYGRLIKVITIGVKGTELNPIASFNYADYINRPFKPKTDVFWLQDDYVYVPNTDLEAVKVLIIPKLSYEVDKLNGTDTKCAKLLDSELNYPDYLVTLAKQETLKEVAGSYKRIVEDERGDDNTNQK